MTENWLEITIIIFILIGIGVAIFRGGAANPVSTGKLDRNFRRLDGDVRKLGGQIETLEGRMADITRGSAKAEDVARLEEAMAAHGRHTASISSNVKALQGDLVHVREATASQQADIEHTRRQVDRLYDFIVERGMTK